MLKRQKRQNRVKYHKGDHVLVRLFKRNSKHPVQVAKGIVSMSNNFKVKVTYTFDHVERTGMFTLDHVSMLKTSKELRREHRQKYYILQDPEAIFKNQGFRVAFDPTPDGSCMFSAMEHQLRQYGIERSSLTLRQEIVKEISQNRTKYESFVVGSFDLYIHRMLQPTTFGDHLCLQAAAMFNVEIHVLSTQGMTNNSLIAPEDENSCFEIYLGHYPEDAGAHYVSLCGSDFQRYSKTTSPGTDDDEFFGASTDHAADDEPFGASTDHAGADESFGACTGHAADDESFGASSGHIADDEPFGASTDHAAVDESFGASTENAAADESFGTSTDHAADGDESFGASTENAADSGDDDEFVEADSEILLKIPALLRPVIPPEIWEFILQLAVKDDCLTRQKLKCVNSAFYNFLSKLPYDSVHIRPSLQHLIRDNTVSLDELCEAAGINSGLVQSFKFINHMGSLENTWLEIKRANKINWYTVRRVYTYCT